MSAEKTLSPSDLRSARWFASDSMRGFAHRQRMQQIGARREDFLGKPLIAIINTWSDLSTCHSHLPERAATVARAIIAAGGYPVELPALSLGEIFVKPTTMLYRNFLAMEVEELLRSHPVDGAVLLGGCDKTTPGLLMGALSVDLPVIFCPAGPTLNDRYKGERVGVGTHTRKFWDEYSAGEVAPREWIRLESRMTRSVGTCNTMGTASTMTSLADALGFTLPGASSIPAADSAHVRMAADCGSRIVAMVWEDLRPSHIATERAFANATSVFMALGGSTNAAIHLIALARRAGVALDLDALDAAAGRVPVLANLFPAGEYLMEDFYYAGGLPSVIRKLGEHFDRSTRTVAGSDWQTALDELDPVDEHAVIRTLDAPLTAQPALAVLRGNLAPSGAVIKPSAASPQLLRHRGRALVFDSCAEMNARINDPDLNVDEHTVLVLRNAGPVGAPGMPEWGGLPIPKKLLARGVRDMVRISDARMSGTHYGTCVLHVAPESAIGGPLALVQTGDEIELDVPARRIELLVSDAELARRRAAWQAPAPRYTRGYTALYQQHVGQADTGCDFDFLAAPGDTPEPDIF
ncbi:L-arabinonate dehydratase [Niveibacterium sp.]|uniref:L-arabinonate dehydratase n=1 Tax=Niveibacterium sp. TaxID=2017444 RepID=UPI0035B4E3B6